MVYDKNIAFNDLPDLPLLTRVGLACCPQDATEEVRKLCHWVIPVHGGQGVFRPLAEMILKAQGHWDRVIQSHLE